MFSEYRQMSNLGDSAHITFEHGFLHLLEDIAFTMSRPFQTDLSIKNTFPRTTTIKQLRN
jgi:hypothetical protein